MLHTINGFYVFFYFLFGTLMLHYLIFFFILAHLILLFKVFSFCFEPKTIFHYIISEGLPTPMNIYILFPSIKMIISFLYYQTLRPSGVHQGAFDLVPHRWGHAGGAPPVVGGVASQPPSPAAPHAVASSPGC